MAAAQRADVDRLLQRAQPALVGERADAREDPAAPTATAPNPARPPERPASPGRRSRRTVVRAAAGALAAAGVIAAAYALRSEEPPAKPPAEADKYPAVPYCREAAGKLPLPERNPEKGGTSAGDDKAHTSRYWTRAYDVVGGGAEPPPHAVVEWFLKRSGRGSGSATVRARADFGSGRTETGLGSGEEAYWDVPGNNQTCVLQVRDGNLLLRIGLGGPEHPASTCESEAKEIARGALAAVPR